MFHFTMVTAIPRKQRVKKDQILHGEILSIKSVSILPQFHNHDNRKDKSGKINIHNRYEIGYLRFHTDHFSMSTRFKME